MIAPRDDLGDVSLPRGGARAPRTGARVRARAPGAGGREENTRAPREASRRRPEPGPSAPAGWDSFSGRPGAFDGPPLSSAERKGDPATGSPEAVEGDSFPAPPRGAGRSNTRVQRGGPSAAAGGRDAPQRRNSGPERVEKAFEAASAHVHDDDLEVAPGLCREALERVAEAHGAERPHHDGDRRRRNFERLRHESGGEFYAIAGAEPAPIIEACAAPRRLSSSGRWRFRRRRRPRRFPS